MLFSFISRIISATGAFLYPGYASYKALSKRPASEAELERWLQYWSVLALIMSIEYVAEWVVSWVPFYNTLKTLFLLYLALPQTQGSSFIYKYHLAPTLHTYEPQIDAALAQVKTQIYLYLQERLNKLWEAFSAAFLPQSAPPTAAGASADAPPPPQHPLSGPAGMVWGLWKTYAPIVIAQGSAFIAARQAQIEAQQAEAEPTPPVSANPSQFRDTASIIARRRQLEAELAALPATLGDVSAAHHDVGEARYEEIARDELGDSADEGGHDLLASPAPANRTSWWGGWGAGAKGYERIKDE